MMNKFVFSFFALGVMFIFNSATANASNTMVYLQMNNLFVAGGLDDEAGSTDSSVELEEFDEIDSTHVTGAMEDETDVTSESLDEQFFYKSDRGAPTTYLQMFESSGYIADSVTEEGDILDGEPGVLNSFIETETVYLGQGSADGVVAGDKFYVVHLSEDPVIHPVSKKLVGYKVLVDGVIEVYDTTDAFSKAKVVNSYDSIERGDYIIPYIEPDLAKLDPDRPVIEKGIEGVLLASKEPKEGLATGDVIYLDIGGASGVEEGDVFNILDQNPVFKRDGKLAEGFPKIVGQAKVISIQDNTSTAYITDSTLDSHAGYSVVYSNVR